MNIMILKGLNKNNSLLHILIIVSIGFAVYFNALFNGYVFDDMNNIQPNGAGFPDYFRGIMLGENITYTGPYYRPLQYIVFGTEYFFWKLNPVGHHLISIIIHLVNSVLVYLFVRNIFKLGGNSQASKSGLLIGLVFAVHPMNTETVSAVSAIQDLLIGLFALLTFLFVLSKWYYSLHMIVRISVMVFLSLLGLMSKESSILVLPMVIVLLSVFYSSRRLLFVISYGLGLASYLFMRLRIAHVGFDLGKEVVYIPITGAPLSIRLLTAPKEFMYYIVTYFFPLRLAMAQQWVVRTLTIKDFWLPIIGLGLFLGVCFWFLIKIRNKLFTLFLIWLLGVIGFHLNILFPLDTTVGDHWFYLGQIGLLGMIVILLKRYYKNPILINIIFILAILLFSFRTVIRNSNYKDDLSLMSHDVIVSADSFLLHDYYGAILYKQGKRRESKIQHEESILLSKNYYSPYYNLGVHYTDENDFDAARYYYNKAIELANYQNAYNNLAVLYIYHGNLDLAEDLMHKALEVYPKNVRFMKVLIYVYQKSGKKNLAISLAEYMASIDRNPLNKTLVEDLRLSKSLDFSYLAIEDSREFK